MGYNKGVENYQKKVHEETLQIVQDAVDAIKESNPNTPITRKILLEMLTDEDTEKPIVAPATLYKDEYLKIWNYQKWERKQGNYTKQQERNNEKELNELVKELEVLQKKIAKYEVKIEKKEKAIEELTSRIQIMKKERRENEDTIEKLHGLLLECDSILALKGIAVAEIASALDEGIDFVTKKIKS